jgi:probable addiction module antidote protein
LIKFFQTKQDDGRLFYICLFSWMVMYLEAAFEDGDPALISAVLGDIARAKGMSQIAEKTGLGRTSLYKALSPEGHPDFTTVLKVIDALGIKLCATSAKT